MAKLKQTKDQAWKLVQRTGAWIRSLKKSCGRRRQERNRCLWQLRK